MNNRNLSTPITSHCKSCFLKNLGRIGFSRFPPQIFSGIFACDVVDILFEILVGFFVHAENVAALFDHGSLRSDRCS